MLPYLNLVLSKYAGPSYLYKIRGKIARRSTYLFVLFLIFLIVKVLRYINISTYFYHEKNITVTKLSLSHISTFKRDWKSSNDVWIKDELMKNGYWNYRNLSENEINKLSVLGQRLFLHENVGYPANKNFTIYIHQFGKRLERRFIRQFGPNNLDAFRLCSVKNCHITYNESDFHKADAVLFHLHLISSPPIHLERKNLKQRWVWLSDESIFNTFMVAKDKKLHHYDNIFNWSMTYRMDSDVPVPYGRTLPLLHIMPPQDLDIFSRKNKSIAVMGSACTNRNGRWNYVRKLQKYLELDTYGGCGKLKCQGHFMRDCQQLNNYKFYLSFENSNCKDYITEKMWWNAIQKEAVPIVMGFSKANYKKHLPPNSFIHVEDFESPEHLANYIKYLLTNKDAYNGYHAWRSKYKVVNEHGYFQSNVFHYCRLCEALNYNSPLPKAYSSMESFWNVSRDCDKRVFYKEP